MTDRQMSYKDVHVYKYQLREDYNVEIGLSPAEDITTRFINLSTTGQLIIKEGYAWDGPSGPTLDTNAFMRGALVHDSLYQLIREGNFGAEMSPDWKAAREAADNEMKRLCKEDGMWGFRAWYTFKAVRRFAASAAKSNWHQIRSPSKEGVGYVV